MRVRVRADARTHVPLAEWVRSVVQREALGRLFLVLEDSGGPVSGPQPLWAGLHRHARVRVSSCVRSMCDHGPALGSLRVRGWDVVAAVSHNQPPPPPALPPLSAAGQQLDMVHSTFTSALVTEVRARGMECGVGPVLSRVRERVEESTGGAQSPGYLACLSSPKVTLVPGAVHKEGPSGHSVPVDHVFTRGRELRRPAWVWVTSLVAVLLAWVVAWAEHKPGVCVRVCACECVCVALALVLCCGALLCLHSSM